MRPIRAIDVIDSGLAGGALNHALDRRCLAQVAARECADVLRFFRSTPTVSLGAHQEISRAVRVDYCRARQIEIARRCSSGGAIYVDADQLGLALVLRRPKTWRGMTLGELLLRFSRALARALRGLGIEATANAPNDVEVGGRKLASVYAAMRGQAVLLQASILLAADVETMLEALRVPTEKLSPNGLAAARDRVASLDECLGRRIDPDALKSALVQAIAQTMNLRFRPACELLDTGTLALDAIEAEHASAHAIDWNGGGAIEALVRTPGGTLRARAEFRDDGAHFERVELAADVHVEPHDLLADLQDVVRGLPTALLPACLHHFVRQRTAHTPGWHPLDLLALLRQAAEKQRLLSRGFTTAEANALQPHTAGTALSIEEIIGRSAVMLVPYCAKPLWCKWRHRDGCPECGQCEVGDAYRLARSRSMRVITILDFEHLSATLAELRHARAAAYIGMCCSHFFIKRHAAFAAAGVPAVLMDIGGANCYELRQEAQAYAGTFNAESHLDVALLGKVMHFVPPRRAASAATEQAP